MWIWFTLLAAVAQAGRNAFQKQLSRDVPVLGVTLARFFYAVPLASSYLAFLYWHDESLTLPNFPPLFFVYVVGAGLAQIWATSLMVQLFHLKNYAIGVGLAKSEAVWAALLGVIFFGVTISSVGWLGVVLGGVAIIFNDRERQFTPTFVENTFPRYCQWFMFCPHFTLGARSKLAT